MSDVIIIGGGPAGSMLGSYLSMAGISNTIFESAIHPRPHVGESMVTATTRVFQEIGFLETMEREGFIRKYGASWHPPSRTGEFAIEFGEFPQEGIHQDYTYHVDRRKFDLLLLKHAEALGTKIYQGIPVTKVLFDSSRATGVRIRVHDKDIDLPAKIVVDASGRNTMLGRQLGLKRKDPIFNQYAVHAWFENVDKGTAPLRILSTSTSCPSSVAGFGRSRSMSESRRWASWLKRKCFSKRSSMLKSTSRHTSSAAPT
jgi:1H-pyrrole-2-carbonyl-[peptidyl-carrier protein] chlorinase